MKEKVELVGVVVKIDGKRKTIKKEDCYFQGWEYADECHSDSGVNLELTDGKKRYKLSL
jgi:hypothetical protein